MIVASTHVPLEVRRWKGDLRLGCRSHLLQAVNKVKRTDRLSAGMGKAARAVFGMRSKVATGCAAVLAAVIGYHVVFGQNGVVAYQGKRHDAADMKQQAEQMRAENERLRGHVDRLSSDPNAIEHEAREELHYTRPGEVVFALQADPKVQSR